MTSERRKPGGERGQYKQLYIRSSRARPFTSSQITYDDYLNTDVWRELRNQRLKLDHYRCDQCGTGINVTVHHLRYPDIWGAESIEDDLVTLCASCHARVHQTDIEGE